MENNLKDIGKLKVVELKKELALRGAHLSGNKAELIERYEKVNLDN